MEMQMESVVIYWSGEERIVLKGEFSEGYFKEGFKEVYYATGELKGKGAIEGDFPTGLWKYFTPEGLLDYRVQYFEYGYGRMLEVEKILGE